VNDLSPEQLRRHAETLELINTEVTASLERQFESGAQIDNKAIILVGYAAVASSFLATRHAQPVLGGLAYAAYGMAAGFVIWAYAVRLYQDVPESRRLFNSYLTHPKAQVLATLAASRVEAFENNARKQSRKASRWWMSVLSLTIGLILMILALNRTHF